MKIANLIPMVILCINVMAQTVRYPIALPQLSSGAYSRSFSCVANARANVASLAGLSQMGMAAFGERRFSLQELSTYTAIAAVPTASGSFAVMADYYGYSGYNESELSIGYGRKINDIVDIGAAFNYYSIRIPAYGKAGSVNFELSTIVHLSEQLHTGVRIYNPLRSSLGKHEKLASSYTIGTGYEISNKLLMTLEAVKEDDKRVTLHTGIQYKPIQQLLGSVGYLTGNNQYYFSAGFLHKHVRLDVTASFHQQLGLSQGLMIMYVPKTKSK